MRTQTAKRWAALALTLVMALSLAAPSLAAVPMMEDAATVEVPIEDAGAMPGHSYGSLAETPAIGGGEAELMGNSYTLNFTTQSPSDSIFTVGGTAENLSDALKGKLTGEYAGYTKGLQLKSNTGDISFTAPSDGSVTIRLVHPNATKGFRVITTANGSSSNVKPTMSSNPCSYTFSVVKGNTYAVGKDGTEIRLLTIEFTPEVPPCADDEHVWGSATADTATCTEPGVQSHTCTVCGQKETWDTDPKGHTPTNVAKEEPTCVDPGKEAGTVCSECDAILTGRQVIPATGLHVDANKDSTCDVCGKTPLAADHDTHNFTIELRNTATCTAAGSKTMQCSMENCDVTTTVPSTALGHDWKNVAMKSATCTSVGWTAHKLCSRCQEKQNYVESPALGHNFGSDGKCSRCDAVMDSKGMKAGGWFEALYAEIDGVTDAQVASVVYNGPINGSLQDEDLEYLVRDAKLASGKNGVRIDIPGLPAGKYSLLVGLKNGMAYTATQIEVQEYDRSGFAHKVHTKDASGKITGIVDYTEGVGAYRDDGIVKDNAIILYVTDENKNTVSVTADDGTTVTGIGNILNSVGQATGSGNTSKGGKPNSNQGILKKLALDDHPLVIRIVGTVHGGGGKNPGSAIEGLTAYDSLDYGGSVGDNGFMARMGDCQNITIEGIGADAMIYGWGFHVMCNTAGYTQYGLGKNFEFRNLTFKEVPEDCIGLEGIQEGGEITAPVRHGWVHNCNFYSAYISPAAESDKTEGDGSMDFKRGEYFTLSYCYFEGAHKTNLIGSSDDSLQFHITWHHNYWRSCKARGPLVRNTNIHIYNCIYDNQTDYAMNPRANAYIFSEYNAFNMSKQPRTVKSGAIKSFMDALRGCINDGKDGPATNVTDRLQEVTSANRYKSFELDSKLSYIPTGDYKLDKDHITARANILAYTGPMKAQVVTPDEVDTSIVETDRRPAGNVVLPLTSVDPSGNQAGVVLTNVNSSLKLGKSTEGQNIVFKVGEPFDVTMSGTGINLVNEAGFTIIDVSGTAKDLPAGTYFIEPNNMQPGDSASVTPATFKDGTLTSLTLTAAANHVEPHVHTYGSYTVTKEATCTTPGVKTATCTAGDGDVDTREIPKIDHNYVDGVCEMCDLRQSVGYDPDATGATTPVAPTITPVSGISLDVETVSVNQESSVTISATVLPADATNRGVIWTTSDDSVATVANGRVMGKKSGTVTITATTKDGGFSAECVVTVYGITKTEKKFDANVYKRSNSAAFVAADNTEIATRTGNAFQVVPVGGTWKTGNNKVYYVTANPASKGGLQFTIDPCSENTVTISASSTGTSNDSVLALMNADTLELVADSTKKTVRRVHGNTASSFTFTNLPAGTYTIVSPTDVAADKADGATGYSSRGVGIHTVTVTQVTRENDDRVMVNNITLSGADSVEMGQTITLTAAVLPADATSKALRWTSSNAAVATVTKDGVVAGVKPGTVTITAAATDGSGKKATKDITVVPAIVDDGNLGPAGGQVTWTLDSMGELTITNTANRIETGDYVLVGIWGANHSFKGVKLIRADQLSAAVGDNWDQLQLIWINNKLAPKCEAETVEHQ